MRKKQNKAILVFLRQNPVMFSSCKMKYDTYLHGLEPTNFNQKYQDMYPLIHLQLLTAQHRATLTDSAGGGGLITAIQTVYIDVTQFKDYVRPGGGW